MIVNTSVVASGSNLTVFTGSSEPANEPANNVTNEQISDAIANDSGVIGETAPESVSDADASQEADEVKPFDEAKFWAEVALIGRMSELDRVREEIAAELAEQKGEWEKLKDETSKAREVMSDLESELKDKTDEFMEIAKELCSVARGRSLKELPANVATTQNDSAGEPPEQSDDGWRLHPTSELLNGIKGSKSKKDLVIDAAPTIGHLEDLRSEASKECVSFNAKLPKGCGKGFAQSIEDLLVEFIGKWVAQRSNPAVAIQADELLAEIRAASQQNGWTKEDCQPKETDSPSLKAGFMAFNEGRPHTDVVVDDLNAAKQWMIGWVGGEFLSK
jgi:hypothetical protein